MGKRGNGRIKTKTCFINIYLAFFSQKNNPHPAPFPIELPVRCIYSIMDEKRNGLIIDPYCGSGTTLIAAKILGYNFIGIDISEDYCKFAEERLRNYKNEEKFVQEEIAKHVVVKNI